MKRSCPGFRVGLWIIDRNLDFEVAVAHPTDPLDDSGLVRERMALSIKPISLDSDGVNDQRVTLPPADRIAFEGRFWVVGQWATIEENLPILSHKLVQESSEYPAFG